MYINHRRIINKDSEVVHGVYPDNKSTFCGFPNSRENNKEYPTLCTSIDSVVEDWVSYEDTDKKATCKKCVAFLKKKGAI